MTSSSDQTGRLYQAATRLWLKAHRASRQAPFALAFMTDERVTDPAAVIRALPRYGPARIAVIFRHYNTPDRTRLALALAKATREEGHLFLVAGDAGLAMRTRADGLHLPEWQLPAADGLRAAHPGLILSVACHSEKALVAADRAGVDCVFLSPVFATKSHPGAPHLGRTRFSQLAHGTGIPVLALGGIDQYTAVSITGSAASGIGAINALDL